MSLHTFYPLNFRISEHNLEFLELLENLKLAQKNNSKELGKTTPGNWEKPIN
jgi:hypothetical protein